MREIDKQLRRKSSCGSLSRRRRRSSLEIIIGILRRVIARNNRMVGVIESDGTSTKSRVKADRTVIDVEMQWKF